MINNIFFYIIVLSALSYSLFRLKRVIFNSETGCTNCASNKSCSSANKVTSKNCNGELALNDDDRKKIKDMIKEFQTFS